MSKIKFINILLSKILFFISIFFIINSTYQSVIAQSAYDNVYDQLMMNAKKNYDEKNYKEALEILIQIAHLNLFETPNFEFYGLLSLTKFMMGDNIGAHNDLNKFELAIMVNSGLVKCESEKGGLKGINGNIDKFDEETTKEVSIRMCGGMYEAYYIGDNFEFIKNNYRLISEFERIKNIIG